MRSRIFPSRMGKVGRHVDLPKIPRREGPDSLLHARGSKSYAGRDVTAEVYRHHIHLGVNRAHVIVNDRAVLGTLLAIRALEPRRPAALVLLVSPQILIVDVSSVAALAVEPP